MECSKQSKSSTKISQYWIALLRGTFYGKNRNLACFCFLHFQESKTQNKFYAMSFGSKMALMSQSWIIFGSNEVID